jgi:hypothetical protein
VGLLFSLSHTTCRYLLSLLPSFLSVHFPLLFVLLAFLPVVHYVVAPLDMVTPLPSHFSPSTFSSHPTNLTLPMTLLLLLLLF